MQKSMRLSKEQAELVLHLFCIQKMHPQQFIEEFYKRYPRSSFSELWEKNHQGQRVLKDFDWLVESGDVADAAEEVLGFIVTEPSGETYRLTKSPFHARYLELFKENQNAKH